MKVLSLLLITLIIFKISSAFTFSKELDSLWEDWKNEYKKSYSNNEKFYRRQLWEENIAFIKKHNLKQSIDSHPFRMKMNKFGDMSNKEFSAIMNGFKRKNDTKSLFGATFLPPNNIVPPESVDWRTQGYVTEVKDQGQCGSCWSFSSTGSLEGQTFKKTGKLPNLSEQNLVDCSGSSGNMGCNGGWMDQAFAYIKDNGGIDTEQCYPYEAKDETCRYKTSCVGGTVAGYVDIPSGNETALLQTVATVGPVSVAIDASQRSFQFYSSGVYDEPNCSNTVTDHAVLAVGYGTLDGKDYWLVKNSWGTSWGQEGYIMMSRNKNNQCAIASFASYPLV